MTYETTLTLAADSNTDDVTAERITLHEVQQIVDDFNSMQSEILVTFTGPFVVSANIIVRLQPANRIMNEDEIRLFEAAFLKVVNPTADDVVISSAKVYYQQLTTQNRRRLQQSPSNDVFIRADGQCKDCSSNGYALLTNDAVGSRSSRIEKELKNPDNNQSDDYFANVTVSTVSQDEENIPHVSWNNSVNSAAKVSDFPYTVLYVLAGSVVVVLAGLFYVASRSRRARLQDKVKYTEEGHQSAEI
jgi:hypothetical protein